MASAALTARDVSRLVKDPSEQVRADTAAKIAKKFAGADLSKSERKIAEEIFRLMVKDAAVRVREALAENLKENLLVPRDVAVTLARDVDTVSLPVLQYSEVLTDEDLIAIIQEFGPEKQKAIAKRDMVSELVSHTLVNTKNNDVVATLVTNDGAKISEQSFQIMMDGMGEDERLQAAMVSRGDLPVTVLERLVTIVSDHMKDELVKRHELSSAMATDLILQSRERAIITLSTEHDREDVEQLVRQLLDSKRLTPSIMLRALCMGDLTFYEASMSALCQLPLVNIRQLIHDSGPLGLKAVYEKTGLPESHYPAVRAAIDVANEVDYDGGEDDRARYSRRMIERILTQYGDLGVEFEAEDLEYLLAKMNELPTAVYDA